jgi:hypothetical protein
MSPLHFHPFEFPGPESFSQLAATVQAGYNGIGRIGGHVFKIEAQFGGSTPVSHDYTYASYPLP